MCPKMPPHVTKCGLMYFHGNQDLAQFVNEVKRDNETLREIDQYQRSIENLVNHV